MRHLSQHERESFERLLQVLKCIKTEANPDAHVLPSSILSVKEAVNDFVEKRGRRISLEELIEICKLHLNDFKMIDQLCQYGKDRSMPTPKPAADKTTGTDQEQAENSYTQYIVTEKINMLCEIVFHLKELLGDKLPTHSNFVKEVGSTINLRMDEARSQPQ